MNWSDIGLSGGNPVTDNPDVIASQIGVLRSMAATIRSVHGQMPGSGEIEAVQWDSAAAANFRTAAKNVPVDLSVLAERYDKVASALQDFNVTLRTVKAKLDSAYASASMAQANLATAKRQVAQAKADHDTEVRNVTAANATCAPGMPPKPVPTFVPPPAAQVVKQSEASIAQATKDAKQTLVDYNNAANLAASYVAVANDDALKNKHKSVFSRVADAASTTAKKASQFVLEHEKTLEFINKWASYASGICALLALVPAFAPLMAPLALAFAGVALLVDVVIMVSKATLGQKLTTDDFVKLGFDVVATATAGVGAWAGRGAQVAKGSAKAAQEAYVAKSATRTSLRDASRLAQDETKAKELAYRSLKANGGSTDDIAAAKTAWRTAQGEAGEAARRSGASAVEKESARQAAKASEEVAKQAERTEKAVKKFVDRPGLVVDQVAKPLAVEHRDLKAQDFIPYDPLGKIQTLQQLPTDIVKLQGVLP